jgi:carotenoid cleavage dioxygenase-like enzyme
MGASTANLQAGLSRQRSRDVGDIAPFGGRIDLATRAPFRSRLDDEAVRDATVRGTVPDWLHGELVRTAPAVFATGAWQAHHWFDGLGMLYAFRVGDGVSFRQKVLDTAVSKAARKGRAPRASFGSPIVRSFWQRVIAPIPAITDNPNVNVVALGDAVVALTEGPHQWEVDRKTLNVTKTVEYQDEHRNLVMLAHPHFDFARNRVVNLGVRIGPRTQIVLFEHAPEARRREVVARLPVGRLPYLHSFGLTDRHALVIGHPFDMRPLDLLWSNRGFIDHFAYRPREGTTLWLIDRKDGTIRTHAAPAGFVFHVVNVFEGQDGSTSIDLAFYPDASIVKALSTESLAKRGLPDLLPPIVRWTVREGVRDARVETLLERGFEFPCVSYKKTSGRRHAVSWGARIWAAGTRSSVVRLGTDERTFEEAGFVFGEPVFVARPGSEREDDGVLVTVGSHTNADRSAMVVLDAGTLDVKAWAEVPLPIPLGFHGSFFRA